MLFGITLAMGPAIAHQSWNTVVKRVSADGGPRSVNRSLSGTLACRLAGRCDVASLGSACGRCGRVDVGRWR